MKITSKQIEKVFRKLEVRLKYSSHHIYGFFEVNGIRLFVLHVSRSGDRELPNTIIQKIRGNLHLSVPEFEQLISGRMSREEYIDLLDQKGLLEYLKTKKVPDVMPTCFISYSALDEVFANKIYYDLKEVGIDCWFASHNLSIGDDIKNAITKEIEDREIVILILSQNSIDSEWVEFRSQTYNTN